MLSQHLRGQWQLRVLRWWPAWPSSEVLSDSKQGSVRESVSKASNSYLWPGVDICESSLDCSGFPNPDLSSSCCARGCCCGAFNVGGWGCSEALVVTTIGGGNMEQQVYDNLIWNIVSC